MKEAFGFLHYMVVLVFRAISTGKPLETDTAYSSLHYIDIGAKGDEIEIYRGTSILIGEEN